MLDLLGGLLGCYEKSEHVIFFPDWNRVSTHGVGLFLTLLSTTTETEDQVEGRLLLDVVVAEGAAVLELLAGEDQALLVRGDTANT